ncbi:MAG TPA: PaaI family thioesterase [Geobacter sp.]|nr:PaaI family thioesterase [Geobacter sp.]
MASPLFPRQTLLRYRLPHRIRHTPRRNIVSESALKVHDNEPTEIDLSGDPGWIPFDAPSLVGDSLRFVSGDTHGDRFRARYYRDADRHLHARYWLGPEAEGPPGHAHGGAIAAIMDESLGLAAWAAGYPIVVGNLNVSFRNMLPLQQVVTVESRVVSAEGRKVMVHGRIFRGETTFAEAQCLCITIPGK